MYRFVRSILTRTRARSRPCSMPGACRTANGFPSASSAQPKGARTILEKPPRSGGSARDRPDSPQEMRWSIPAKDGQAVVLVAG